MHVNYRSLADVPLPVLESSITGVLDTCTPGRIWVPAHGAARPEPAACSQILLHGAGSEMIVISIPVLHLADLAAAMLGPLEAGRADLDDMVRELANTIAGNLKALLGSDFSTGIPEAVACPVGAGGRMRFTDGSVVLDVIVDG